MDVDAPAGPVTKGPKGKTAAAGKEGAERFTVKKWNAVALWAWDIVVDNCAICRNHIMDHCIECQANQTSQTAEG
ncbi:RING-box protein 1 [Naganishia friedmannii]|uniref:RING-box protein 1 n=1 Tax=Naganishia friedmannii TaxID=89922 RepID=A0ACC2W1J1_9TREE|nr:RING-box protein 1 [Naganishia friedmannii]